MAPLLHTALGARWGTTPVRRVYRGAVLVVASVLNLTRNPRAVATGAPWSAAGAFGAAEFQTGALGAFSTFFRVTKNAVGAVAVGTPMDPYVPGATYTAVVTLRASANCTLQVVMGPTYDGSGGNTVLGANVALVAGVVTTVARTGAAPSVAPTASPGVRLRESSGAASGLVIDASGLMVTPGTYPGPYRDGRSPGWVWSGTPDASASRGWN